MVQRYIEGGYGASEMEEDAQGDWVRYEDYAVLQGLMFRLTDQFNLCELPDDLYEALEAAGIL